MKTPKFWQNSSLLGDLLSPLGWIYYRTSQIHRKWQSRNAQPKQLIAPIICIGNVTAGGAGKTPTARMLSAMFKIAGQKPHFISRGYGGTPQAEPLRVNLKEHIASQVGDEPLLLAQMAPCWVSTNRQASAEQAVRDGASIVIADDGLQNSLFYKDTSLLVMDSQYGIGNGKLMPAGPLREPLEKALNRCDGIILIGDGSYKPSTTLPIWPAKLKRVTDLTAYQNKAVIAFAAIATPQKFFDGLKDAGMELIENIAYADHHPYSTNDVALLLDKAEEAQAVLMTTAKDYVKLPETFRPHCIVVDVKLQLEQPREFLAWLEERIAHG